MTATLCSGDTLLSAGHMEAASEDFNCQLNKLPKTSPGKRK